MNFQERLDELRQGAADDDITPNEASFKDATKYLAERNDNKRPAIVLLDNGNIRCHWDPTGPNRLSIEFFGGGKGSKVYKDETGKLRFANDVPLWSMP